MNSQITEQSLDNSVIRFWEQRYQQIKNDPSFDDFQRAHRLTHAWLEWKSAIGKRNLSQRLEVIQRMGLLIAAETHRQRQDHAAALVEYREWKRTVLEVA